MGDPVLLPPRLETITVLEIGSYPPRACSIASSGDGLGSIATTTSLRPRAYPPQGSRNTGWVSHITAS